MTLLVLYASKGRAALFVCPFGQAKQVKPWNCFENVTTVTAWCCRMAAASEIIWGLQRSEVWPANLKVLIWRVPFNIEARCEVVS
eukprot:1832175-Karenia_brevis.AAC.1